MGEDGSALLASIIVDPASERWTAEVMTTSKNPEAIKDFDGRRLAVIRAAVTRCQSATSQPLEDPSGAARVPTPEEQDQPMSESEEDEPMEDEDDEATPEESSAFVRDEVNGNVAGTGGLEHLVPRWIANEALATETAYEKPKVSFIELLLDMQGRDAFSQEKKQKVTSVTSRDAGAWRVDINGLLRYRGGAYVPDDQAVRQELMAANHDDPYAGHFGTARTTELIRRKYFWRRLAKDVEAYVGGCDVCQRSKAKRHRPYGALQSLPTPTRPWKDISMDFIVGLPPSVDSDGKAYDAILVAMDRFSKMAKYFPVLSTMDAPELANLFCKTIVKDYGTPRSIVSDRDKLFTSDFWSTLCYYMKAKRRLSTAFHPQTDGQTERQNQVLEHYLRSYIDYRQDDWVDLLYMAEFSYNNSVHSVTGVTPFYAVLGYHPELAWDVEVDAPKREAPAARDRAAALSILREELTKRLKASTEYQTKYYNKHHKPMEYNAGDMVMLSSKNISLARPNKKLSHKFLGPFQVKEPVGSQAYKLILPKSFGRTHPVFHVSLLEPYRRRPGEEQAVPPPPILIEDENEWEVEAILDERLRRGKRQFLVRWVGYPPSEDSWQPEEDLENAQGAMTEFRKRIPVAAQEALRRKPRPRLRKPVAE
jgi:hypothetical protein